MPPGLNLLTVPGGVAAPATLVRYTERTGRYGSPGNRRAALLRLPLRALDERYQARGGADPDVLHLLGGGCLRAADSSRQSA